MVRDGPTKYQYWSPVQQGRADHWAIAHALLDAGANLEAKDAAGKGPLHHAVSGSCSALSRRIAVLLLERGASVSAQDRLGEGLLHDPILGSDLLSVQLLVEAGVDPSVKNDMGFSKLHALNAWHAGMQFFTDAAKRGRIGPAGGLLTGKRVVLRGLTQGLELNGKEGLCGRYNADSGRYEVVLDGVSRAIKTCNVWPAGVPVDPRSTCAACAASGASSPSGARLSRCGGCFTTMYCSAQCQAAAWKDGHKQLCKEVAETQVRILRPATAETVSLGSRPGAGDNVGLETYTDFDASRLGVEERAGRAHFIVKAQVPLVPCVGMPAEGGKFRDTPLSPEDVSSMQDHLHRSFRRAVRDGDSDAAQLLVEEGMAFEARASGVEPPPAEADLPVLPILVYSEGKEFVVQVMPGVGAFTRIITAVRERGIGGAKAYFDALLVKDGAVLVVDVTHPRPAQPW